MTIWIGLDPGSISGAVGALDSNGDYLDSFMIEHKDKNILPLVFKNMILRCIDPREGAEICMEAVHSMPNQGVASSFQFGRAVGVISAVAELTNYPFHLVTPQKWKNKLVFNFFFLTKFLKIDFTVFKINFTIHHVLVICKFLLYIIRILKVP